VGLTASNGRNTLKAVRYLVFQTKTPDGFGCLAQRERCRHENDDKRRMEIEREFKTSEFVGQLHVNSFQLYQRPGTAPGLFFTLATQLSGHHFQTKMTIRIRSAWNFLRKESSAGSQVSIRPNLVRTATRLRLVA
jgi:hypothetical protein